MLGGGGVVFHTAKEAPNETGEETSHRSSSGSV